MPDAIKNEKKIDGLKAGSEAIANSRKIVLESIGENENIIKEKTDKKYMLDGLARKNTQKIKAENLKELESEKNINAKKVNFQNEGGLKFIDSINFLHPAENNEPIKSVKKDFQTELKKRIDSNQISPALLEDINKKGISFDNLVALASGGDKKNINKTKAEKVLEKKEIKQNSNTEKKASVEKEKVKNKKIEEGLKNKKKKEEVKEREAQKRADMKLKKEKRKKAIISFFKNFKNNFVLQIKSFKINFIKILKKTLLKIVIVFFIFIFLYLTYVLTIIKFNIDKPITRTLSRYLPVPAFIVKNKVIGFYFWQDIKSKTTPEDGISLNFAARKNLAKYLAMNELAKRYNLESIPYSDIEKDVPKKQLAEKAIYDEIVNLVSIKRIRSIKNQIDNKGDFIRVSEKLGDELGKTTITSEDKELYSYYKELDKLNINEISDIIATENGYYIYRCFEKNDKEQILSYVLVKNKNINQILDEMINGYKLVSFVD